MNSRPTKPRRRVLRALFPVVFCAAFLRGSTLAQDESAPQSQNWHAVRSAFRGNLIRAILPEKRAWLERLRDFEKRFAAAHDYAGAIKIREEREALEQELMALEHEIPLLAARAAGDAPLLPERIPMKIESATLTGVKRDKDGALAGWDASGASAVWQLPSLPNGGYEVIATFFGDATEGVSWMVQESLYYLRGAANATLEKAVEKNLGTLRVSDGAGRLTLTAQGGEKTASLRLVSLELAPVNR